MGDWEVAMKTRSGIGKERDTRNRWGSGGRIGGGILARGRRAIRNMSRRLDAMPFQA